MCMHGAFNETRHDRIGLTTKRSINRKSSRGCRGFSRSWRIPFDFARRELRGWGWVGISFIARGGIRIRCSFSDIGIGVSRFVEGSSTYRSAGSRDAPTGCRPWRPGHVPERIPCPWHKSVCRSCAARVASPHPPARIHRWPSAASGRQLLPTIASGLENGGREVKIRARL